MEMEENAVDLSAAEVDDLVCLKHFDDSLSVCVVSEATDDHVVLDVVNGAYRIEYDLRTNEFGWIAPYSAAQTAALFLGKAPEPLKSEILRIRDMAMDWESDTPAVSAKDHFIAIGGPDVVRRTLEMMEVLPTPVAAPSSPRP